MPPDVTVKSPSVTAEARKTDLSIFIFPPVEINTLLANRLRFFAQVRIDEYQAAVTQKGAISNRETGPGHLARACFEQVASPFQLPSTFSANHLASNS